MSNSNNIKFGMVNGFRMRYRAQGQGHPFVSVTGLLGSIEQEDAMAGEKARFKERYTVIHHDSRGRGQSEYGSLDYRYYTWEAQAEDLRCLLDHLGYERSHFIGGSQGAAAILALGIRHPDRVSGLILVNPPEVRVLDPKYIQGTMDYADFIEKNGMEAVIELVMALPPNDTLKVTHPTLMQMYENIMRAHDKMVVAAATRGTVQFEPILADDLKKVKCPVLVLSQGGDGLHPTDIAEYLGSNIPDCEVFIAPSMTWYHENPSEAPRRIMNFLSRIDGTVWD